MMYLNNMKYILIVLALSLNSGCITSNKNPMPEYLSVKDILKMAGMTEQQYNENKSDKIKWIPFES